MKTLFGNSEGINTARWSDEPAPTPPLLEASTLFQRVTDVTCRVLSDTSLAVNCLKATLGSSTWFYNWVNWWWLQENDTCCKIRFFTGWKMTMLPEFLEFPYTAKISVCQHSEYLFILIWHFVCKFSEEQGGRAILQLWNSLEAFKRFVSMNTTTVEVFRSL